MRHRSSLLCFALLLVACGNKNGGTDPLVGNDGSVADTLAGDESGFQLDTSVTDPDTGIPDGCAGDACPPEAYCGDGKLTVGEACDDGNAAGGDGCTADCKSIETNWACPTPGAACTFLVKCGDGKVMGGETCDDGNTKAGDGCNASCAIEAGWVCLTPGATCTAASCGDGIVAGAEKCDDKNGSSGDGCSSTCQLEAGWACPTPATACKKTVCGDTIPEGTEQCDDGNIESGDGCTPFCAKEPTCSGTSGCTSSCGDGMKLGAEACDDGNTVNGDGCSSTCVVEAGYTCTDIATGTGATIAIPIVLRDFRDSHADMEKYLGAETGIVQSTLGTDNLPQFKASGAAATVSSKTSFDQWYRTVAGVNVAELQTLTLTKQPDGSYQYYSSNFFPLDGKGFGNEGRGNNFHFTSVARHFFQWGGDEKLDFCGDDDVWVFVNRQLALDLGGVHGEMCGSVVLDDAKGASLSMSKSKVYEIDVFQAERHTTQSNYKLTLRGFAAPKSSCKSRCGDGVVTPDEVCDDGKNDGTYGSCTSDCKRGPHCGDKIVQSVEECDDGVNLSVYGGCAPGCKKAPFCGDAKVDGAYGEQCDDGVFAGGYGGCATGCKLGPRCGDGVLQMDQEQCEDGNTTSGDGCSATCKKEGPK
jgi:fibro-slime domain-containing protein